MRREHLRLLLNTCAHFGKIMNKQHLAGQKHSILVNQTVLMEDIVVHNRPDIVVFDKRSQYVKVIDVPTKARNRDSVPMLKGYNSSSRNFIYG